MDEWEKAAGYLPMRLRGAALRVPEALRESVQEIRLRAGAPLTFSTPAAEWMLSEQDGVVIDRRPDTLMASRQELQECFQRLCEYSVHSHQEELRRGFISTSYGCRAGVAGSTVVENGNITSVRDITSLCIRIARQHLGCANRLLPVVVPRQFPRSTLICGEPSSGKSSLLKDLARSLSEGGTGRRYRVSVVDERGELSHEGLLAGCDVLRFCPKAAGIEQAIRCLAPDVVLFDELGGEAETEAVCRCLHGGVAAIATAHCRDLGDLRRRRAVAQALREGAFEQVVLLAGRGSPGTVKRVIPVAELSL